ncbi:MAG: hypothetical protein ORO03_07765, partial [Alphaproteobacteria bacterium]|nr:hypothetical protein [Alphaproteobacteria bacterium]
TLTSGTATGGLTVTGSNINNQGVVYGGAVTIQGVGSGAGAARDLRYIEGNGVTVSGAASSFTGGLLLRASGSGGLSLGADLTTNGTLRFTAISTGLTNMALTSSVTTAGGVVTIDLGANGVYSSGGYTLTTSNRNLDLRAGSVTGAANDATVFAVGSSGTFSVSGTAAAATTAAATKYYDYGWSAANPNSASEIGAVDPNAVGIANWIFYGGKKDTATIGAVWNLNFTVFMNSATLTAGKVVKVDSSAFISRAGMDGVNVTGGNVKFKTTTSSTTTPTDITLTGLRNVNFVSMGTSAAPVTVAPLPAANLVIFTGANYLTGDVTLNTTGAITQTAGAGNTLSIAGGGKLIVTGSTAITLNNSGNSIGSLGALTATGAISITTGAGISLNGDIASRGAINLTATSMVLGSAVTVSGGAVTLALGSGA